MKKIIIAVVMMFVLPAIAVAAEKVEPKVHTMQNSDPTPAKEAEKTAKPEHQMQNNNPAPAKKAEKPEHVMQNN